VREREPDETAELFPPPGERSPVPAHALDLAAERMTMLRAEAKRREKRVRETLRKQALARLNRLDIPVHVNAVGHYEVARGRLMDEEMKVLMDPSLHKQTQALLAGIARQQHEQAIARALPIRAPRARSDQPDLDLATLAAARRKSKGVGDD
jgi:hypothetical protein